MALPTGQVVLDQGCKGDGSLAWVKTRTIKGDLHVASMYGDRRRGKRIALWKWMEQHLPEGKWLFYGDFNNTEFVEDSMGPTPLMYGSERWAWNRLSDRFDLIDNRLTTITKLGPHFTR